MCTSSFLYSSLVSILDEAMHFPSLLIKIAQMLINVIISAVTPIPEHVYGHLPTISCIECHCMLHPLRALSPPIRGGAIRLDEIRL